MNDHHQTAARGRSRRGALLLLVLSVLTLFMMIGTLMLVLAMRARSTARAFADAVAGPGIQASEARGLLDEALMVLLRGKAPAEAGDDSGPQLESLLADRYGDETLKGRLEGIGPLGPILEARVTIQNPPASSSELHGRILTMIPAESDPAPISSFRILSVNGNIFELANLRTVEVRPLPSPTDDEPCDVVINGREFAGTLRNESWDAFDGDGTGNELTPFITQASAEDSSGEMSIQRPAYGEPGEAMEVDNDGDGVVDGILLDDVLPPTVSGAEARVSYLVLDLGGRLNVNAHGSLAENPGTGPAGVDGNGVFPANSTASWDDLLAGVTSPAEQRGPATNGRRCPPSLGGEVDGRFGGMLADADPYAIRLDFDGTRLASRQSPIANVFTCGELEPVLRPYDGDTRTLPPRLTAILGTDAEAVRMLLTTDSWDTCGMVGATARTVAADGDATTLPEEASEGLRFNLDRELTDQPVKQEFFEDLVAVVMAAGVPAGEAAQWCANVVEFIDNEQPETQPEAFKMPPGVPGPDVTGVEPATLPQALRDALPVKNPGSFESPAVLLAVPAGTKAEIELKFQPPPPGEPQPITSLAVEHPEILDAVTVASPFRSTVFVEAGGRTLCRWREPGRINVNTCDDKIWNALTAANVPNPFKSPTERNPGDFGPAKSMGDLLIGDRNPARDPPILGAFSSQTRDVRDLNVGLGHRLANIATTRSDVFAVWITLELNQPGGASLPEYHRLFAIVDRSIPVGYAPGRNLNVRDTLRVLRYLE